MSSAPLCAQCPSDVTPTGLGGKGNLPECDVHNSHSDMSHKLGSSGSSASNLEIVAGQLDNLQAW